MQNTFTVVVKLCNRTESRQLHAHESKLCGGLHRNKTTN